MSTGSPKFDKEIELAKINLVAKEWRCAPLLRLGTLLWALVAVSAVAVAAADAK